MNAHIAEVNIHLRAKELDRSLIDQAASLVGSNRSQFMLACALKEAKSILLDQTTLYANNEAFQKALNWLDAPLTEREETGMKRIAEADFPWVDPSPMPLELSQSKLD
jgi:uncharacterized protein (DUF1778 family)